MQKRARIQGWVRSMSIKMVVRCLATLFLSTMSGGAFAGCHTAQGETGAVHFKVGISCNYNRR